MEDLYDALQLLELGRGILANLPFEVRSDISVLANVYPKHAKRFQELRDQIDSLSRSYSSILDSLRILSDLNSSLSERHFIVKQLEHLLKEIQFLNGLRTFYSDPRGPNCMA